MTTPIAHLINGQIVCCPQARLQDVFNPATGAVSGQVELASRATVETAIASAEAAFPAWRDTLPLKRARILARFQRLLEERADEICAAITARARQGDRGCPRRTDPRHRECRIRHGHSRTAQGRTFQECRSPDR